MEFPTKPMGWKHNKLYTKNNPKNCSHIFTHKCKKVESKPFNHCQSIIMLNIEFIMCCIQSLRNFSVLTISQKYFKNGLVGFCQKIILH